MEPLRKRPITIIFILQMRKWEPSAHKATMLEELWLLKPPVTFPTLTLSTGVQKSLDWQSSWLRARWRVTMQTEGGGLSWVT